MLNHELFGDEPFKTSILGCLRLEKNVHWTGPEKVYEYRDPINCRLFFVIVTS
jgi:hypothetical protein